jgi:hypothetical protein
VLGLAEDEKFGELLYRLLVSKNEVKYYARYVERQQADLKKRKHSDTSDHIVVHLSPFDSRDERVRPTG